MLLRGIIDPWYEYKNSGPLTCTVGLPASTAQGLEGSPGARKLLRGRGRGGNEGGGSSGGGGSSWLSAGEIHNGYTLRVLPQELQLPTVRIRRARAR
eukprot:9488948-Pyramimonas_sp.AAC.1